MSRKLLPHLVAACLDCECSLLMLVKWMQVLMCGHRLFLWQSYIAQDVIPCILSESQCSG